MQGRPVGESTVAQGTQKSIRLFFLAINFYPAIRTDDVPAEVKDYKEKRKRRKQGKEKNVKEIALEKGKFARSYTKVSCALMPDDVLDPVDGPVQWAFHLIASKGRYLIHFLGISMTQIC